MHRIPQDCRDCRGRTVRENQRGNGDFMKSVFFL